MKTSKVPDGEGNGSRKLVTVTFRKAAVSLLFLLVGLLTFSDVLFACDGCKYALLNELVTDRKETLQGQEAIKAMLNQGVPVDEKGLPYLKPNEPKIAKKDFDFVQIINRDKKLPVRQTSYVPQEGVKADKEVSIDLAEGEAYMGNGVWFKGFTTNGTIPGPTIIVDEGDIVKFTVNNKGTVPHGASLHAAYTQTSKYLGKIEPGESKSMYFKVTHPGVYMYHCAPGGHAIPMHVIFGQYGMMVVRPKQQYKLEKMLGKKPDAEINLLQHEWYSSGKDAIEGKPQYVTFNGKLFKYVEEPIKVKPGDYVRINFLNVGPNLLSTFHIVGILWDYAYWQGLPENVKTGGQTVTAGPSDSWVIEFRAPPDEGKFLMLSHAVGSTDRGAIGILEVTKDAVTPVSVKSDGVLIPEAERAAMKEKAVRVISPFEPGTEELANPTWIPSEKKEVTVSIMGNSFYPKVLSVAKGTTIRWINEEIFTYMEGEFSGIHNVVGISGPENFASDLLTHAQTFTKKLDKAGEYDYLCAPHPYMRGKIIVRD